MSSSICQRPYCHGYICLEDEDGQRRCLSYGRVANPIAPLDIPSPVGRGRSVGVSFRDKLRGNKPKPYSLAQHPGA